MDNSGNSRLGRPPGDPPDWAAMFIKCICKGMHAQMAASAAGVDYSMPYHRKRTDPEFRKAWAEALIVGTRQLEGEAVRRAYHGVKKPVYHRGIKIGSIREYSDRLLMFLLEARKPKKYRQNVEHKHTGVVTMQVIEKIRESPPELPVERNGSANHADH